MAKTHPDDWLAKFGPDKGIFLPVFGADGNL
jgi:hypothetical protein